MLVELEYKAMSLFIATGDGMMRRQVFAEMDDARALRLSFVHSTSRAQRISTTGMSSIASHCCRPR